MLPYLLAIAGGYLIGNSMKETPTFDEGGVMEMGVGGLSDAAIQRLDAGYSLVIHTDTERPEQKYTITIEKVKGKIQFIVRKGNFLDKKVKSFDTQEEAFDYISQKVGKKVKKRILKD